MLKVIQQWRRYQVEWTSTLPMQSTTAFHFLEALNSMIWTRYRSNITIV